MRRPRAPARARATMSDALAQRAVESGLLAPAPLSVSSGRRAVEQTAPGCPARRATANGSGILIDVAVCSGAPLSVFIIRHAGFSLRALRHVNPHIERHPSAPLGVYGNRPPPRRLHRVHAPDHTRRLSSTARRQSTGQPGLFRSGGCVGGRVAAAPGRQPAATRSLSVVRLHFLHLPRFPPSLLAVRT